MESHGFVSSVFPALEPADQWAKLSSKPHPSRPYVVNDSELKFQLQLRLVHYGRN
jgi:hypothetical protein